MKRTIIILIVLVGFLVSLPHAGSGASFYDLKIKKHSWKKSGFGTVALHSITIKNESKQDMRDIVLLFLYYSESEIVLTSKTFTLYKKIPKGATRTFSDINVGFVHDQAASCDVEIIGAKVSD